MSGIFDQDKPEESTFARRMREGRSTSPLRIRARVLVDNHLLKASDDPDDFDLDVVTWAEWEDFTDFAESVLNDAEALTWP